MDRRRELHRFSRRASDVPHKLVMKSVEGIAMDIHFLSFLNEIEVIEAVSRETRGEVFLFFLGKTAIVIS